MPRFFFHLRASASREIDSEGIEFDTLEDAVADAKKARAEMLSDQALEGVADSTKVFEITDQDGQLLATVPFFDA